MRRIILVNQKGGCGKTTTAINLSCCLAGQGKKTLLIDMDPQGHAGMGFGVKPAEIEESVYEVLSGEVPITKAIHPLKKNLDAVFSNMGLNAFQRVMANVPEREYRLAKSLKEVEDHYDYLIIDSPSGVGLLTFNGLMACEEVVIPVDSSLFSLHELGEIVDILRIIEEKTEHAFTIRILATNMDRRTNFCKGVVQTLTKKYPEACLKTVIQTCTRLREAVGHGKPVADFDKRCNAFRDYQALAKEIVGQESVVKVGALGSGGKKNVEIPVERKIVFTLEAPVNANVLIAGDFNHWVPEALNLSLSRGKPVWQSAKSLSPGSYEYKFLVNGQWVADPKNSATTRSNLGGVNSVVNV